MPYLCQLRIHLGILVSQLHMPSPALRVNILLFPLAFALTRGRLLAWGGSTVSPWIWWLLGMPMLGIKTDPMALLAARNYPGVKGQGQLQHPSAPTPCTHQTRGV